MFKKGIYNFLVIATVLSTPLFLNNAYAEDDIFAIFDTNLIAENDTGAIFDTSPVAAYNTDDIFGTGLVVQDAHLDGMRGAALDLEVLGVALFDAISLNNSANGTVSGGNIINEGAFSDSSGLSTIIQNSGNNVQIQSATILNLNID